MLGRSAAWQANAPRWSAQMRASNGLGMIEDLRVSLIPQREHDTTHVDHAFPGDLERTERQRASPLLERHLAQAQRLEVLHVRFPPTRDAVALLAPRRRIMRLEHAALEPAAVEAHLERRADITRGARVVHHGLV